MGAEQLKARACSLLRRGVGWRVDQWMWSGGDRRGCALAAGQKCRWWPDGGGLCN